MFPRSFDSANPRRLYVFYLPSVYKSEDGGKAGFSLMPVAWFFADNDYWGGIISTSSDTYRGVEISKDHGRTWQEEGRSSNYFNDYSSTNVIQLFPKLFPSLLIYIVGLRKCRTNGFLLWPSALVELYLAKESRCHFENNGGLRLLSSKSGCRY